MKVTFQIEGGSPVVIECNAGENLLELARRANVAIDAPCSGNGSCGKCRVKLVEGTVESPKTLHISDEEFADGWRLSCSSRVPRAVMLFMVAMSGCPFRIFPVCKSALDGGGRLRRLVGYPPHLCFPHQFPSRMFAFGTFCLCSSSCNVLLLFAALQQ